MRVAVIHDELSVVGGQHEPAHAERPDVVGGNGAGAVKLRGGHRDLGSRRKNRAVGGSGGDVRLAGVWDALAGGTVARPLS
uniref:Uncharacterized protein n=1 Tax=Human herpesvirus 2 TaxID=10310 RepID=A0A481TBA6_HHV2|nr:hypothetical protein [Human alphaherpesvirus 2]